MPKTKKRAEAAKAARQATKLTTGGGEANGSAPTPPPQKMVTLTRLNRELPNACPRCGYAVQAICDCN